MEALVELLGALGVRDRLGADHDGYPWVFGYRGPSLGELGFPPAPVADLVEDQLAIKSDGGARTAARELQVGEPRAHAAAALHAAGRVRDRGREPRVDGSDVRDARCDRPALSRAEPWFSGAVAGYRGQIGRNAAIPHALPNNIVFQAGDVLVTGATAPVWGYHSELERTMVIGPPSDEQKRMFDHMLALQDLAIDAIRPGRRARRSTGSCGPTTRSTASGRTGGTTSGTRSAALPRGAVPRPRRPDRDPPGHGLHRRAGALRAGARRLPALGHGRGDGRRRRVADVLPARPRALRCRREGVPLLLAGVRSVARGGGGTLRRGVGASGGGGERRRAGGGKGGWRCFFDEPPGRCRDGKAGARYAEPETAGATNGASRPPRSTTPRSPGLRGRPPAAVSPRWPKRHAAGPSGGAVGFSGLIGRPPHLADGRGASPRSAGKK